MITVKVPLTAKPGQLISVNVTGATPGAKYALQTVDDGCNVAGRTSNAGRIRADGTLSTALLAPTRLGAAAVELVLKSSVVAGATFTVKV